VAADKEIEKVVEEVKAERLTWDLELSSIDPTKKLSIIKEVRGLTGLGLKEVEYNLYYF
jgi:ribosomal protein L7/L12